MSTPSAAALARTAFSSPSRVRSATPSRSRRRSPAGSVRPRPRAARRACGSARARSISRNWNISGVTTSDSRDVDGGQQRLGVHDLGEHPQRGLHLDLRHPPCSRPRTRGERRRRLEGAAVGDQDRQVLLHAVDQLLHRLRRRVAAGQHDRGQVREGPRLVRQDQAGNTSDRSPGAITVKSSRSRVSTFGSDIAATTNPATPRCSHSGLPRTSSAAAGRCRSATVGATSSGISGHARRPPARSAPAAARDPVAGPRARPGSRSTATGWACSGDEFAARASSTAPRDLCGSRPRPCTTSTTGEPRFAAIWALTAHSLPVRHVGVVAADAPRRRRTWPTARRSGRRSRRQRAVRIGVQLVVGDADRVGVVLLDRRVRDSSSSTTAVDGARRTRSPAGRPPPGRPVRVNRSTRPRATEDLPDMTFRRGDVDAPRHGQRLTAGTASAPDEDLG